MTNTPRNPRRRPLPVVNSGLYSRERLLADLSSRIIGQPEALETIVPRVQLYRAGLNPEGRPAGAFVLLGPTGTGKTATVEALAEVIHGSRKNVLRIDCGEFQMEHEVAKLIGAPPGYLGHRETQPVLTQVKLNQVMSERANLAIVLFDEIEKAAPSLLRILLGVLDKGSLRLGDNTTVQFERTLIFFTSNLGSEDIARETSGGFGLSKAAGPTGTKDLSRITSAALKNKLPSEFMNRIDSFITYAPLGPAEVTKILEIELQALADHISRRLGDRAVYLQVPTKTRSWLVSKGFSARYGARELKRTLQKHLLEPLGELIISGAIPSGEIVRFDVARSGDFLKLSFDADDNRTLVSERGKLNYIFKKEAGTNQ
jgi:ATP-dependent Clp protease ATP-binding subunit ClpA